MFYGSYEDIAKFASDDFAKFQGAEDIHPYIREKHIRMVCSYVINFAAPFPSYEFAEVYVKDAIHGLNHIFFLGYSAK